ncbi:MAG TPA: citrate synthase [Caldilineae bacterium]|nr:citrate synthase [Caldilineae bacterium]
MGAAQRDYVPLAERSGSAPEARGQSDCGEPGSLAITDGRTGRGYEIPIAEGAIRSIDLRQIKVDDDDFGIMSYDPSFYNTASCRSAITHIDGDAGVLLYRGYPIEQLVEHSTFLETAYLLLYGELPTQAQLEQWLWDVNHHTLVNESIRHFLDGFRYDAHPVGVLIGTISALSTFYPDARNVEDPASVELQTRRLVAKMPTLAAFAYRHSVGLPYAYPDDTLSYTGDFLNMMFKMTELRYEPNPVWERALNKLFILQADHGQATSATTMRMVGSSLADPFVSVAASLASLHGPRHGGAAEEALGIFAEIGDVKNVPQYIERVKRGDELLMGFGHRVYKSYDPRARAIKQMAHEVFAEAGASRLLDIALELERVALEDDYFIERKLYPNVDFYTGCIYQAIGIPRNMFTVMFAIPRTAGWVAQWRELLADPEQRIARPRQIYDGVMYRDYVPIEERD